MYDEFFGEWSKVIDDSKLSQVLGFLGREYAIKHIFPAQENIFKPFLLCPYKDLKVVMLGQDPYPQKGIATGILFGNKLGTKNISPSLEIIMDCVLQPESYHNPRVMDITLESWAKQGVLMINSALTVEENKVGSHTMLWREFTSSLLSNISRLNSGTVFVLFGQQAQTFTPYIDKLVNPTNILQFKHPAYFARQQKALDCDAFKKIDTILKTNNNFKINWYEEY